MDNNEPPSIPKSTLRDRLVQSRKRMGWDQVDIAPLLGIHDRTVSNYENDKTKIPASTLVAWAELTRVPLNWLAKGECDCGRPLS